MLKLEAITLMQDWFELTADFEIKDGARVAVIGPSGAGKSTLLAALAGFLPLTSGKLMWNDTEISMAAPDARPIAMLFQDNNLFPHLSISQNVGLGLRSNLRLSSDEKQRVATALDRVGLGGFGSRKPAQLSGGQQSRAALARVMVQNRPLVLLDEPFAALGPALKAEMLDLVGELLQETGASLMMVSHDPQDALHVADQTVLVADGCASAPMPTVELLRNPPPSLKAYLG